MKFIYISPFKSQNITNFTFWKVILLEIHEVHLIQGDQFLGTTGETDALISSLKRRLCQISPQTQTSHQGGPEITEKTLTVTVGPSEATSR